MKRVIRLLHLFSSFIVASLIVLQNTVDFRTFDLHDDANLKKMNHWAGVAMIFSGVLLILTMKRKYPTAEERVWIQFFSIKFVMSISVTPFADRLIKNIYLGFDNKAKTASSYMDYSDSQEVQEVEKMILQFKLIMIVLLFIYSTYIKTYREDHNNFENKQQLKDMIDRMMSKMN